MDFVLILIELISLGVTAEVFTLYVPLFLSDKHSAKYSNWLRFRRGNVKNELQPSLETTVCICCTFE